MSGKVERQFKGVWIPKEIWTDKKLTINEKVILTEIDSFSGPEGCFASNQHFADFIGLSANRCSAIISDLKAKNKITVTMVYHKGTQRIAKRYLKVIDSFNNSTPSGNGSTPSVHGNTPSGNGSTPSVFGNTPSGNAKGTNTSNTNTITNTKDKMDLLIEGFTSDIELVELLSDFKSFRKETLKSPFSKKSLALFLDHLESTSNSNIELQKKMLTNSIINGWKSVFLPNDKSKRGSNSDGVRSEAIQPVYCDNDSKATAEDLAKFNNSVKLLNPESPMGEH